MKRVPVGLSTVTCVEIKKQINQRIRDNEESALIKIHLK
jgi:hypothetical protein